MKTGKRREKALIYNTSFFDVSQTFIYNQVESVSEEYVVDLLAKKFLNPHNYNVDAFGKIKISQTYGLLNRLANKVLNINIFDPKSCLRLLTLLRKNNYKVIHAHFGTNAVDILPFAKIFKIPLVVSFHGADASRMLSNKSYVAKLPGLFEYASAITISSNHMADSLKLNKWEEKVYLIPYGVDTKEFAKSITKSPNTKKEENGKIKILHAGRIVGKKGVPDLIKVFGELSGNYENIELHLAGDGEEIAQCRKLVTKYSLEEDVIFYGSVSHEKIKNLMDETDIFVLNSRVSEDGDMEGTPNGILEAMYMGKAVLSTRHAGIPYVIEHGKNGLLADEKSNDQLKHNLEKLIKDANLGSKLGEAARETILQSYTIETMKNKLKTVFKQI